MDSDTVRYFGRAPEDHDDGGEERWFDDDAGVEYDVLDPPTFVTEEELRESPWASQWMPRSDDAWFKRAQSAPLRVSQTFVTQVVDRFADVRGNWTRCTLRSLLEAATGLAVAYCAYVWTGDLLWALAVGMASATAALVANSVLAVFADEITHASWGRAALRTVGVTPGADAEATRAELRAAQTVLFGYAGLGALAHVLSAEAGEGGLSSAAATAAAVSVAVFSAAELFSNWTPSRRMASLLIGRWTHVGSNWAANPSRSFLEVCCWVLACVGAWLFSEDLVWSLQAGTAAAVMLCLSNGLDTRTCECKVPCEGDCQGCTAVGEVIGMVAKAGTQMSLDSRARDLLEGFSG